MLKNGSKIENYQNRHKKWTKNIMHVHVAWQIDVWVFVKKPGSRITCQRLRLKCQGFKNVGILFIVIHLSHALLLIFSRHDLPYNYLNISQI